MRKFVSDIGEPRVGFTLQASLYNIYRMTDKCRRDPRKEACNGVDKRLWEGFDIGHSERVTLAEPCRLIYLETAGGVMSLKYYRKSCILRMRYHCGHN